MNIGLYNLEPKINNSAMMQVSAYYKSKGDNVSLYSPLFHDSYDKIYAFSLFDFTDKSYVTPDMICGGTGFDITSRLPPEIEQSDLDYTIFPDCDYSIIWFSRGCFRKCPFCVVNKKEGDIRSVEPKNLNPNGKFIKVMDNNFFANPNWRTAVEQLKEWNQPIDMQGFDIRIFDEEQGEALTSLKHYQNFKFAWDNPKDNIDNQIELLLDYIKPYKLMCYVLIGYWSTPEEDLMRVNHLWEDYKIIPFVMPYDKFNPYQRKFSRWVNNRRIFKTSSWEDFKNGNKSKFEKGKYINTTNPYIKTKPRKWTADEIEYMTFLKKEGYSIDNICKALDRSKASVTVKLKRLKKTNGTYNEKHLLEKIKINKQFVEHIQPKNILDLYHGRGNEAYKGYNVISNDINKEYDCDYHLDALHCLCKLFVENKKFDIVDLDPYGSAYDCFDLAIKMAKKGLCITLGEMGHKRWKRLDFVKKRYGINNFDEFTCDKLINTIQDIGLRNKKQLTVFAKKDWQNISRVWFTITPYKEVSQWDNQMEASLDNYHVTTLFDF